MRKPLTFPVLFVVIAVTTSVAAAPSTSALSLLGGKIVVTNVASASRQFIDAHHTIHLTPGQENIKKKALGPMAAPCCANSSAYTCCCPCNLSKTIWGLSNIAIARHGADAKQVREAAIDWLQFVNPNGSHGDACYNGRCESRFRADGCGGMKEKDLAP